METGALTKSTTLFGGFLSSLLKEEQNYIEYLREGRQRAFFVTSHSIVGTLRSPHNTKGGLQDYYLGQRGKYNRGKNKKRRGNKPGRDGRTSRQRLRDMQKRPKFAQRFGAGTPTAAKFARNFGRANALVNTVTAGLEFSDRLAEGQSVAKAGIGTAASVAGGLAGAGKGAAIGASIGSVVPGVGTLIGGVIGAAIGGYLGSTVAGGAADLATGAVGLSGGGVMKSATRSVIAEKGEPEWLIPFDVIGKLIIDSTYNPVGSLMVGAASGLLAVLPTNESTSQMKIAINRASKQFGFEKVDPAIKGSASGIANLKLGLDTVMTLGMEFVSNIFVAGASAAGISSAQRPNGPVGQQPNTNAATGKVINLGLDQKEAFKKIYDLAVKDGRAKFPELVAAIAMHETGYLTVVGGNNPFNQRPSPGDGYASSQGFIDYATLDEAVAHHIKLWHLTDRYDDNFNAYSDANAAFAALAYKYAPPSDGNNPEAYKKAVADMIATMMPELEKPETGPEVKPNTGNKVLSKVQYKQFLEKFIRFHQNPHAYRDNSPVRLQGVGTMLVGTDGIWPVQNYVVKFFDPNGTQIDRKAWIDRLKKVKPEDADLVEMGVQVQEEKSERNKGGPDLTKSEFKPTPIPTPKDTADFNVPVEKRDTIAMDRIEDRGVTFLPIMLPGPNIPVESIVERVVSKKEPSYFDPFSHGVKRGKRIVI